MRSKSTADFNNVLDLWVDFISCEPLPSSKKAFYAGVLSVVFLISTKDTGGANYQDTINSISDELSVFLKENL